MGLVDGARTIAVTGLWLGAGAGWVAQLFLPWTTHGILATSAPIDAIGLLRGGVIDSAAPPGSTAALLTMPAAGLGAVGLSGFSGRAVAATRLCLAVVVSGVFLTLIWVLADGTPARLALGAWVTAAGLFCALAALVIDWRRAPELRRRQEARQ